MLVVSANVGTLGRGAVMADKMKHLVSLVESKRPAFAALHFQEVGGEDKDLSMVAEMNTSIASLFTPLSYVSTGLLMHLDAEHSFTALGSCYLVREDALSSILLLHRPSGQHFPLPLPASLPVQDFFLSHPLGRGRKGFLLCSFLLWGSPFHLLNIHLPADVDNTVSLKSSPSPYALERRSLLRQALGSVPRPTLVAGDLNFRPDLAGVWASLSRQGDVVEVKKMRSEGVFKAGVQLRKWDDELQAFCKQEENGTHLDEFVLEEPESVFCPTYCYNDDGSVSDKRCPAWTDRVLATKGVWTQMTNVEYGSVEWGCDHHMVHVSCVLLEGKDTPAHTKMRHAPDEALATGIGRLVVSEDDEKNGNLRRRRGPNVLYQMAPTALILVAAAAVAFAWWKK